ncbi:MAG: dihydrolipoyl dehydrogenase [Deltaproteobacteria bacterium]|nr:dihydrolipoyl dehydrogenase [Deltaproteobacteria bacterium]
MDKQEAFDLVVIGSGPGGYVAAARASQLGLNVACVEKSPRLGGVCLNVGCIPSKALLDSSEYYHLAREHFAQHGILIGSVDLDLSAMMDRKNQVVSDLTNNVRTLLEGHKVQIIEGTARLSGADQVAVKSSGKENTETVLKAQSILIATGSIPISVPGLEFDGKYIISSTEALSLTEVPKHLIVVGGGYIGLELGSVWSRLGAKATVVEMLPQIAGNLDGQVARTLFRLLKAQGITFRLNTRVKSASIKRKSVRVTVSAGDKDETLTADRVLVAVGRRPNTNGLGLANLGIETDSKTGLISVNDRFETTAAGIYAIGDLIPGPALAHKASAEGTAVAECIAGLPGQVNYDTIPAVIYTWPEVAGVGLTEEAVSAKGVAYCVGTYPFSGAGRARAMGETDGFVKVITHAETDRILGVQIIGPRAADMIAECVLAMEFGASAEDIGRTIHGHPTFSEALQEAALVATRCSIYTGPAKS